MAPEMDETPLAQEADQLVQQFQRDASREAGIFHHLITLPTYHETALGTDVLSQGYFGISVCWLMYETSSARRFDVIWHQ